MVGAGWYDDPLVPGGKRWWTGQAWTEETRAPPSGGGWASGDIPKDPAPWVPGGAPRAAPDIDTVDPWALRPIAQWLARSLRVLVSHAPALLSLYCVLPVALVGAGYIALRSVLSGVVIFFGDDPTVDGLGPASLTLVVAALLFIVVGLVGASLAGLHFLVSVHWERPDQPPPDPMRSLGIGVGRIPRLIGVSLLLALIWIMAAAALGLAFAVVGNTFDDAAVSLVAVVAGLLCVPVAIWLVVKLAFVQIAVVAAPPGTSTLRTSSRLSAGRFWPVLVRLVVWVAVGVAVSIPVQLVNQGLITPRLISPFGVAASADTTGIDGGDGDGGDGDAASASSSPSPSSTGAEAEGEGEGEGEGEASLGIGIDRGTTITIDGTPLGDLKSVALADVLPGHGRALPLLAIGVTLNGVLQALQGSLLSALYVDAERRPRPPR